MIEFRKKQKKWNLIMKTVVIIGAVLIFIYIGAEPYVAKYMGSIATIICGYICDAIIIAAMATIFYYFNKFSKSDSYLTTVEHEISDAGYYLIARDEDDNLSFKKAVIDDLSSNHFNIQTDIELSDFEFDIKSFKGKDFIYMATVNDINRNDILAYLDSVITDLTVMNLKRKGNVVITFLTDKADESAIELSKMITPLGRKDAIKIALSIVEFETKRCYFLGNMETKNQANIANYIMNCDLPIKEKYISKERLPYQNEVAKKMENFDAKAYRDGNFFVH